MMYAVRGSETYLELRMTARSRSRTAALPAAIFYIPLPLESSNDVRVGGDFSI